MRATRRQVGAAALELPAVGVERPDPQRHGQPEPAVGGGAAAQAHHDPAGAQVERGPDELAGAPGRGRLGVALRRAPGARSRRPGRARPRRPRRAARRSPPPPGRPSGSDGHDAAGGGRPPPPPARRGCPRRRRRPARRGSRRPGTARRRPAAIARAAAAAGRAPLKGAGATTTAPRGGLIRRSARPVEAEEVDQPVVEGAVVAAPSRMAREHEGVVADRDPERRVGVEGRGHDGARPPPRGRVGWSRRQAAKPRRRSVQQGRVGALAAGGRPGRARRPSGSRCRPSPARPSRRGCRRGGPPPPAPRRSPTGRTCWRGTCRAAGCEMRAPIDETKTTEPPPASRIPGSDRPGSPPPRRRRWSRTSARTSARSTSSTAPSTA